MKVSSVDSSNWVDGNVCYVDILHSCPSKNKTKKVFMCIYVDLSFSYFVAFTALSTLFTVFAFNT